jgi:hypothetical protein
MINFDIHQQMLREELGVTEPAHFFETEINVAAARIIFDRAGGTWAPWYGPHGLTVLYPINVLQ